MADYKELKDMLTEMLAKKKEDKALEDATRASKVYEERNQILNGIGKDMGGVMQPFIDKLGENSRMSAEELRRIIADAVHVEMPGVDTSGIEAVIANAFANLKLPTPKVNISVPPITVPKNEVKMPDKMTVDGEVTIKGVGNKTPFPVVMMDAAGKPMTFPVALGGAAGGRADFFTIKDIQTSTGASLISDAENAMRVTGNLTVTIGSTYATLANADGAITAANPLPTSATISLPSGQGDSATATRVVQAGDSISSVYAQNPVAQGDSATALRVVHAGDVSVSTAASQVGTWNIATVTTVTGITNTVAASMVDSGGAQYSGSNPVPITGTVTVGASTNTTAANIIDSSGVAYSGSNPVPTQPAGNVASGTTDSGNPVKVGGVAMTTLPTAVADAQRSNFKSDKLGRQTIRTVQVRELVATAYVTLSTGTEATLLAAGAGQYLDLIYIMCANTSSTAQQVDVRAVTAGNIVMSVYVPANSTAGVSLPVPFPQDATGNNWTVDMADVTNSNILISALFSKES